MSMYPSDESAAAFLVVLPPSWLHAESCSVASDCALICGCVFPLIGFLRWNYWAFVYLLRLCSSIYQNYGALIP